MGLTWAVVWAPVGPLIGMIVDPDGSKDEPWAAVGAYPGFLCGVVFSMVLWIAEGRRRFDELSLFPSRRLGGRWLVCWWACFRLFWGRNRLTDARCGCCLS